MKPNIIYLHSHDTGRYIQPFGYACPSPNLQKLAEEGMLFRDVHCAGPTCSPSRAGLLTGEAPHSCGMFGLAHRGFRIKNYDHHIINELKQYGYTSALAGMHHVTPEIEKLGYDEIIDKTMQAVHVAQAAEKYLQRKHTKPFFLTLGTHETHRPFEDCEPDEGKYLKTPVPLPDTKENRQDMAGYLISLKRFDDAVGKILKAVDDNNLRENTLIICTTDHGLPFPDMKCNLTNHGTGVYLLMRGPSGFSGGKVTDSLLSHIDIFPTICDVLGVEKPARLQGKSFLALTDNQDAEINEEVFSEVTYHAAYEPKRAIKTKKWNYIKRFNDRKKPVMSNCDNCLSKDTWVDEGWREKDLPQEQLYDLIFDPNESFNLAEKPEFQSVKNNLSAKLLDWMQETNDPLLEGPVHHPGAIVTPEDALNPSDNMVTL